MCDKSYYILKNYFLFQLSDDYLRNVKAMSPDKKAESLSKIQKMFNRAKEYSDDKVQLAIQTYELVSVMIFSL